MSYRELEALRAQVEVLEGLLAEFGPDDWKRPTRCTEFDVRELTGHLGGALYRYTKIAESSDAPEANRDRVSWWSTRDPVKAGPRIVQMTKESVGERSSEEVAGLCLKAAHRLTGLLDRSPDDLVGVAEVGIRAGELAAVAVTESGIHTMDLGHATLKGERLDPQAAEVLVEVLDALLGERPPKRLGWDTRTYILNATGRRQMEPNERFTLGDRAVKFPLIS